MATANETRARELLKLFDGMHDGDHALERDHTAIHLTTTALDEAEARGASAAYERCADSLNHALFVRRAGLSLEEASKALSASRSAIYEARERKPLPPTPSEETKR